jgi:hypothetical protein
MVTSSLYANIKPSPFDKGPKQAVDLLSGTVEHTSERLRAPHGSTD